MSDPGYDVETPASDPAEIPSPGSDDEPDAFDDERLNLLERMLARLGFWAGSLAGRWNPAFGPFFSSDGRLAAGGETRLDVDADPPPPLDG